MRTAALMIVVLCSLASVQAAEIPAMKSVSDVRGLAPIALVDGWTVRVGLGDSWPPEAEGPWKILYCLADPPAGDARGLRFEGAALGETLGPLFYTCSWGEHEDQIKMLMDAVANNAKAGPDVFYAVIPLAWKGTCHIRVMNRAGAELLSKDVIVAEEPVCYWQTFVESNGRATPDGPYALAAAPAAAVPIGNDMQPSRFADVVATTQPVPQAAFTVQLDRGRFIVRSEDRQLGYTPWRDLLARWWVNGRPVVPPRSEKEPGELLQSMHGDGRTRQLDVAFGLPSSLGALHAGDQVELQLLYASGGRRLVLRTASSGIMEHLAMLTREMAGLPMLSNRMGFVITEEMLAASRRR